MVALLGRQERVADLLLRVVGVLEEVDQHLGVLVVAAALADQQGVHGRAAEKKDYKNFDCSNYSSFVH